MMLDPQADSGVATFRPRARLLKLIGAELISDDVVAITELVKNAHDADASFVSIQFSGVTGVGGEIIVRDDGHGMDRAALLTRWMEPAGSGKGRSGTRFTAGGRRVLGEKGVGRFAADKLASKLELVSRAQRSKTEICANFDWSDYEHDERMLNDVESHWEVRKPEWIEKHGTILRLSGLRSIWTERMFRRLATRLARLVSPIGGPSGFRIRIESDEFPEYSGDVGAGFLDSAPYRIDVEFDRTDHATVRVDAQKLSRVRLPGGNALACGLFKVRIHAFDLETEALARIGPRMDVRAWLREWSGVSVYRDGFRIWPYGEPHDDWLRLDQRRVNNPVTCLSNNQIVGFVEIGADANPDLRDQTNREGLIHNEAFKALQTAVVFVLQHLEAHRQSIRHPEGKKVDRRLQRTTASSEFIGIPETIERIASSASGNLAVELKRAAKRVRNQIASEEAVRRRVLDGYSELAATGQAAVFAGRSIELGLVDLRSEITTLRAALEKRAGVAPEDIRSRLARCEKAIEAVTGHVAMVTPPESASRRRRGLDLVSELNRIKQSLEPVLRQEKATFTVQARAGEVLRSEMRPESFAAIIQSLVRNSLEWRAASRAPEIVVSVKTRGDLVEVGFSDNGKGVKAGLASSLFEPAITGREGATGMGLTLARQILSTHGGQISLVPGRKQGATFSIQLARKRSRATTG